MTHDKAQLTRRRPAIVKIAGLLFACLLPAVAAAQSVTFDIQPRVVRLGESATASLVFRGIENPQNPGFPQINGIEVQGAGTEQSITINNGVQSIATTIKYTLVPKQAGRTTIGPFTYDDGHGKRYDLPAISFEVVAGAAATGGSTPDLLFAKLEPATTNLYVQQVFDLMLRVYASTRLNVHSLQPIQNLPAQGLIVKQPRQLDTTQEAINGEVYNVYRFALKAQAITAGRYEFNPAQRAEVISQRRQQRSDFFDSFFNRVQTEGRDIRIEPVALVIQDLPAQGRPASFAGAVGQFTFEMTARPQELAAGDPVTLNFRVAGRGNVESVQMPALQLGELFKTYDAKLLSQNYDENASAGEKTFEQVVIPRSADVKQIPQLIFSWFDPEKRSYESITRGPFALAVRPAPKEQQSLIVEHTTASPDGEKKTELLGTDIIYLKPAPKTFTRAGTTPWHRTTGVLAAQAVPALAVVATLLLVRRREKVTGDIARSRRLLAPKSARAGVERARAALAANDARQFHDALWEAMSSYFGHRLNLLPGDVTPQRIDDAFARAKVDGPQRRWIEEFFAVCESARYGGVAGLDAATASKQIAGLEDALRTCEKIKF